MTGKKTEEELKEIRKKQELATFRFLCVDVAKSLAPTTNSIEAARRAIDIVTRIYDETSER